MLTVWLPQGGLRRAVLRVSSVLGPSGIPSGLASLAVFALSAACALPAPCAAFVLGPGGASSLFAGAAPAKLRAYLWAFKSETRARCFFRIMDLQFSCW